MRLLFVDRRGDCTAPSAARLTQGIAAANGVTGLLAAGAGTAASASAPLCSHAPALRGGSGSAMLLTPDLVAGATLILTATRADESPVAGHAPAVRNRMMTIRQAGRWAQWMLAEGFVQAAVNRAAGIEISGATYGLSPAKDVQPMPDTWPLRMQWIVAELDACRGVAPEGTPATKRSRRRGKTVHPDDLPDPHRGHQASHDELTTMILADIESLLQLIGTVQRLQPVGLPS